MLSTNKKKLLLCSLATGIMTGTSYIPFQPWAILFNFVPLWWFWLTQAETKKQVFWSGWLSQFILNLIGFFWVFHTSHEFGHIPLLPSLLVLFLFASLAHLYFPLIGILIFQIKKKTLDVSANNSSLKSPKLPFGLMVVLMGFWALAELYWPYVFQWNMGYTTFWAKLPIYHWADVIGFHGLSVVLLLFNAYIVWSLNHTIFKNPMTFLQGAKAICKPIGLSLILFLLLNFGGWFHGKSWSHRKNTQSLRFLPIQANIGNAEKIMAERGLGFQQFILQKFIRLSQEAIKEYPQAQILVWPESAIPDLLDSEFANRPRPMALKQFITQSQRMLITGAYSRDYQTGTAEKTYNSLFVFNAIGQPMTPPYRKKHLLAFGEYTPFGDWFPILNEISPSGSGFARGPGPQVLELKDEKFKNGSLRVAPQICYESLYPDFSRLGTKAGAQILINVTNDSWFGTHSEPYQHLSMTFARAIENRRPLLRVTNTGITSAIEASGEILDQSPLYSEWSKELILNYEEKPKMTLYTRYGGSWPFIVLLFTLGGLFSVTILRNKKSKRDSIQSQI